MSQPIEHSSPLTIRRSALALSVLVLVLPLTRLTEPRAGERPEADLDWIAQFATRANEEATALAIEGSGIYVTGYTSAAFPGETRHHRPDAFIQRYDFSGTPIWTDQFGTDVYDYAFGVDASPSGVYVVGSSNGTLPGATAHREFDAFVRAYDFEGNVLWTREFGGRTDDYAYGVAVDDSGVFVVGYTHGTLTGELSRGRVDAFVRKYRIDGQLAWTRQFGTSGRDEALSVAAGPSGVYVSGSVSGALQGSSSTGELDAFVRKYTHTGRESWTRQFGSAFTDEAFGLALAANAVYVVGSTTGQLLNEPGLGSTDAFVRKYRIDGRLKWTRQFGTEGEDVAEAVTVGQGVVDISGWTDANFPDQSNSGLPDVFLQMYESSGRISSTLQFGSSRADAAAGIGAGDGVVFITGDTHGTLPGATRVGKEDAFLARVSPSSSRYPRP